MKRAFATFAITTMMLAVPTAALAKGGGGQNHTCQGGHNCNTTVIGDTDGDGKVRYECHNASGGLIVVNAANCTNIFFPILVIVDL